MEKDIFTKLLDKFPTRVSIPYHDKGFLKLPKTTNKRHLK